MWTPGIKWDVRPQSYTHMTEFFGPLLAVMRADDLDHAIELVNQTGYGLTSGLESLDPREVAILEGAHKSRQPVYQPGHHRGRHLAPALRRNGQISPGRGNEGRRPQICGPVYGV